MISAEALHNTWPCQIHFQPEPKDDKHIWRLCLTVTYMICASSGTFVCLFEYDDVSLPSRVVDAATAVTAPAKEA